MKTLYLILFFLIVIFFYYKFTNKSENFSDQETQFAQNILLFFKQTESPSFIRYLEKLNELKNTSDNLISKGVFNKFMKNKTLSIDDILNEL